MSSLVLRGGTVVDGTGQPAVRADVRIEGGLITHVGLDLPAADEVIDATGLLVTPGFVDVHAHYDGQATWDPHCLPSGIHGVTTVVVGNCGVGFAPVHAADRDWLVTTMEGVEDIPGTALHEGIQWNWTTFPEFLDALEAMPRSLDLATQLPHAALRGYVLGQHRAENDQATPQERDTMRGLAIEALQAGALGISTSRTPLHKTADGVLMAGTHADVEELYALGEAIGTVGHGVFEMSLEHITVPQAFPWLRELARRTKGRITFNLQQIDEDPALWKRDLDLVKQAQDDGLGVYAQVPGRGIGILHSWDSTVNPFRLCPTFFMDLAARSPEDRLAALRDPAMRATLLGETPMHVGDVEAFVTRAWHRLYPLEDEDYEPDPSRSVAARAERLGRTPEEVAYDILMEDGGKGILYLPLFNYVDGHLDALRAMHLSPGTLMGLADGGAHCGTICDGGMPTFMLAFWGRDRARGERLPLEFLIHRQTQATAAFYGLADRGVLAPGYRADVNLIDFENLALLRPQLVADLPAGGKRWMQRATGYVATICAGEITFQNGVPTEARPGRVVRGPASAPA